MYKIKDHAVKQYPEFSIRYEVSITHNYLLSHKETVSVNMLEQLFKCFKTFVGNIFRMLGRYRSVYLTSPT